MALASKSNRATDGRITVLFVQSQSWFGADSQIHASIAEHLDRDRFRVLVACNDGDGRGSPALDEFRRLAGVEVIPTDFGPSRGAQSATRVVIDVVRRLPFVWGLIRLAWHARRIRVDVVHGTEKPRDVLYGYLLARASGAKALTQLLV
jgi:hypothetical protein